MVAPACWGLSLNQQGALAIPCSKTKLFSWCSCDVIRIFPIEACGWLQSEQRGALIVLQSNVSNLWSRDSIDNDGETMKNKLHRRIELLYPIRNWILPVFVLKFEFFIDYCLGHKNASYMAHFLLEGNESPWRNLSCCCASSGGREARKTIGKQW